MVVRSPWISPRQRRACVLASRLLCGARCGVYRFSRRGDPLLLVLAMLDIARRCCIAGCSSFTGNPCRPPNGSMINTCAISGPATCWLGWRYQRDVVSTYSDALRDYLTADGAYFINGCKQINHARLRWQSAATGMCVSLTQMRRVLALVRR